MGDEAEMTSEELETSVHTQSVKQHAAAARWARGRIVPAKQSAAGDH